MRDLLGMCFVQRRTDLTGPFDARAHGNGSVSAQHVTKAFAFDVFHGNGRRLAKAMQFECAADVSVRNLAGQTQLVPESFEGGGIAGDFRPENLHRHDLAGFAVARPVDDAHAAATDLCQKIEAVTDRAQGRVDGSGDLFGQNRGQIIMERGVQRASRPQERIDIVALAEQITERRAKLRMALAGIVEKRRSCLDGLPQRRGEQPVGIGFGLIWRCCSSSHRRGGSEHRFAKPGLGRQPIALDSASGDRERFGGLLFGVPRKVAAFNDLQQPGLHGLEAFKHFIEGKDLFQVRVNRDLALVEIEVRPPSPSFQTVACARVIDDHLTHGAGGDAKKMMAIVPAHLRLIDELEIGLVHQAARVEDVAIRSPAAQLSPGN